MKILQIITPKRFSGAERVCAEICEELQDRGHHVLVATKANPAFQAELERRGVPYEVAKVGNKFHFGVPFVIARIARRMEADVIHTHLSTAAQWGTIAAYLASIPCVSHVHAMNTAIWFLWSTQIIAVAEAVKVHVVSQGRPAERVSVVYNAVDVNELAAVDVAAVRAGLGLDADSPLIAVAAHLSARKGHHILLQALASLRSRFPSLRCLIMGEGSYRTALAQLVEHLELSSMVELTGFRDDARDVMAAADVVVLPSIKGEGMPLSLLEAAARGRPVVATRLAGIPELVLDGETGFVVEPGDEEELATRLAQLLGDPPLREQMGRAARERTERLFSRPRRGEAIERVYLQALDAKGRPIEEPPEHTIPD